MTPILGILASGMSGNLWAPGKDFDSIASYTVGSGGINSVTFSSIPSTYRHLQVRYLSRDTSTGQYFTVQFNSDTSTSSYTWHYLNGDGSTATAGNATTGTFPGAVINYTAGAGTSIFSAGVVDILDYTNTNKYKTIRTLNGYDANGSGVVNLTSSLWLNTTAITSIKFLFDGSNNIDQYSSFALYGVK